MAVTAFWMAFNSIDATLAPGTGITLAVRAPTRSSRHPTNLRLTHGALKPVTTPFFH